VMVAFGLAPCRVPIYTKLLSYLVDICTCLNDRPDALFYNLLEFSGRIYLFSENVKFLFHLLIKVVSCFHIISHYRYDRHFDITVARYLFSSWGET
jgi:hypothetical protein